ncbi:MAG TPA: hypothetical protein VMS12_07945 [Thermoanaerobaculia bacterium]|nr:hypothetical protein [Thermoanaerobaculia bacterium]
MLRFITLGLVIAVCSCVSVPQDPIPVSPACSVPEADRAWIDRSLKAWRFASREIAGIGVVPNAQVILFSEDCVLRSENALSNPSADGVTWTASPHTGTVSVPDGSEVPAGVTSYAAGEEGARFFVMATPSVWAAAGIGDGSSLETMLVAVMLHEASHLAQIGPYGPSLGALIERNALPDSFNDNSVQESFGSNEEFAASVKRETELFMEAAAAEDDAVARRLAGEARRLMLARQQRWLVGEDAWHIEAENIWLTFEGAGQWIAYQWLIHPRSGAHPTADVLARFTRGRQWSQTEGFALVMALDRIAGPDWKRHAYGDGALTVPEMLDEALGSE